MPIVALIRTVLTMAYNAMFCSREYDQSMHWSASEVLFKCVVENDVQGVRTYIESGEDVNAQNEEVPAAGFCLSLYCT
jgi:hypothetical protein